MSQEGHEVASRGWNNVPFTGLRTEDLVAQLTTVSQVIHNSTGA